MLVFAQCGCMFNINCNFFWKISPISGKVICCLHDKQINNHLLGANMAIKVKAIAKIVQCYKYQFNFNLYICLIQVFLSCLWKGTRNLEKHNLSRVVRKPAFCICKNKDADQLHGSRKADQSLYFRYIDSTIPLVPKSEIPSL